VVRLWHARVCGRLRRIDDLVRILGGCRDHESLPGGALGRRLAADRLACDTRIRRRFCCAAADAGLATAWTLSAPRSATSYSTWATCCCRSTTDRFSR